MADKNVIFRTSMGGFNKADVTEYIDKQNAEFKKITQSLNNLLAERDAKIVELNGVIEELTAKLTAAEAEAAASSAASDELARLNTELDSANANLMQKDEEIEKLKAEISGSESEKERKAELYDDMSSQVGDILISANKSADGIIAEATAKAEEINRRAANDADVLRREFTAKMARISSDIRANAKSSAEQFKTEISAEIEALKAALSDALGSVDEKNAALSSKAEALERKLDDALDNAVIEIEKETENLKSGI